MFHICTAHSEDAAALLNIYAHYVKNTAVTFEYDVPTAEEFAQRISRILEKYPYLIAQKDGCTLGYAYAGPFKTRVAYAWSAEVSIYVAPFARRCGMGRRLYAELERLLAAQNVQNLYACIAVPNEEPDEYLTRDSAAFHARMGYRLVGECKNCGRKFNRWYSMIWMEKHIGAHGADCPEFVPFVQL